MTRVVVNEDTVCDHFDGEVFEVWEPFVPGNTARVPGWICKACGWRIGAQGLPPAHECPEDGERQRRSAR